MKRHSHQWQYFEPYMEEYPAKIFWKVKKLCTSCLSVEIVELEEPAQWATIIPNSI